MLADVITGSNGQALSGSEALPALDGKNGAVLLQGKLTSAGD